MKFTVIGAGMAGLLAAAMLRDECSEVLEAQPELPHNHSALLRFRSSIVGDALNIPFRKVKVMKAVVPQSHDTRNPVGDALAYSLKTNGTATLRSSISANGEIEERYIAPQDLVTLMPSKVTAPIKFNCDWGGKIKRQNLSVISTIPMPTLMRLLKYDPIPEFKSVIGFNVNVKLKDVDVCATLYYPDPGKMRYRASLTGDRLTVEYAFPGLDKDQTAAKMNELSGYPKKLFDECYEILTDFGLKTTMIVGKPEVTLQQYGKIVPIDDGERKRFIMWASENHGIYSLGRFATWRPGLLMDDLVNDVRVIQRVARDGAYDHKR